MQPTVATPVANFVQKTFEILRVPPLSFSSSNTFQWLRGFHQDVNSSSSAARYSSPLHCPGTSDTATWTVSSDRYSISNSAKHVRLPQISEIAKQANLLPSLLPARAGGPSGDGEAEAEELGLEGGEGWWELAGARTGSLGKDWEDGEDGTLGEDWRETGIDMLPGYQIFAWAWRASHGRIALGRKYHKIDSIPPLPSSPYLFFSRLIANPGYKFLLQHRLLILLAAQPPLESQLRAIGEYVGVPANGGGSFLAGDRNGGVPELRGEWEERGEG